ncbi:VOC family protein, partial [Streptomyces sp. NPDC059468]
SSVGRVGRFTEAGPGPAGSVVAVEFTANGQKFVALNGGPQFKFNEAISFQIFCADQEEIDHYWNRLTENGGEGGPCGWLKDRYGVSWQVVPDRLIDMIGDPDPEKATRTSRAMLSMGKLDIAELDRAYAGE